MSRLDPGSGAPMLDRFTPLAQESNKIKQYVAALAVSLGSFCAGTVLCWTSPALPYILHEGNSTQVLPGSPGFTINSNEAAMVGSILTVGALLSAIPAGYLADKLGRKSVVLSLAFLFSLNWLLITFAANVTTLIAARFVAGVALGGICVAAPMYIAEIADSTTRGILGSFFNMFLCSGILFTCIAALFFDWLGLALALGLVSILFGSIFFFMPETPLYLVGKGNIEEARKALKELRGQHYDVSPELQTMQKEVNESQENSATLRDVVTNKGNIRALVAAIGIFAFQQLCGINALVFYTVLIFKAAGSTMSPSLSAIIMNVTQVVAAFVAILVIEKANRKFFLVASSIGMMLSLTGLGTYFHLKQLDVHIAGISYLPICSMVLFMVSFAFGYGPVPFMMIGEIFTPEIRGLASGIAIVTNWLCSTAVTFSFPILNHVLGEHITFYIFAGHMALATLFVIFFVPETRGKSLLEIQEMLNR